VYAVVAVALVLLAARSNLRAQQWHDEFTLFGPELKLNPASLAAHQVLGVTYAAQGRDDLAAQHLAAALKTKPDDPRSLYNLGNLLLRHDQPAAAIPLYRRALAKYPSNARIHNNLGVALGQTGDPDGAEAEFRRALEEQPGMPEATQGLAVVAKMRAAAAAASQPAATQPRRD
jgi:Tfp pilus assembly protein PilF